MKETFIISACSAILLLQSCSIKDQVAAETKRLDSVNIILNSKLQELNKCDTALLGRAITKFSNYSTFIENNITDTITKEEANSLQQFYQSGKNLKAFSVNYKSLRSRTSLVSDQIKKLISDVEEGSISKKDFLSHFENEVSAASQLISLTSNELKNNLNSIQDFKNSLLPVEALIKSRNSGQLPEAIKDKVDL
ncbi:MAG: hypothetical protein SGJ15_04695 [Bacteroidota bacterium]|nr:hypothetical protein [Bacteroidota bacterium]